MLEINMTEEFLVARRIVYEEIQEGSIPKLEIRKAVLHDMQQSQRCAETTETENNERQTAT